MNTQQPMNGRTRAPADQLRLLGWDGHFDRLATEYDIDMNRVARVLSAQRGRFLVADGRGERLCTPCGKLRHGHGDFPVTGDWVLADQAAIERVLPRKTLLQRGEAGSRGSRTPSAVREQPMGANIDTAFIVCGLDRDYNLRRIERYLTLVYNCSIEPVVVLTKADLHDDPEAFRQEAEAVAMGVPVILASITDRDGVPELHPFLREGRTAAMISSSGAGKSTLANRLCGDDMQATAAVSASVGKGRHTTTVRELIRLPGGGLLMDNPGIREIALSGDGEGVDTAFPDILDLAASCRFSDCTHEHEPGCAVLRAVENGDLAPDRLESYRKMTREMGYLADRAEKSANRVEKERRRDIALHIRRMDKRK